MFNYDTIIKQLEAMSPIHQDEFAQKLIEKNSGLAAAISTKINIAHQDKYYTDTEAIDHPHKYLLTKDMLEAGTYLGEYPNIVKGAVGDYIRENRL